MLLSPSKNLFEHQGQVSCTSRQYSVHIVILLLGDIGALSCPLRRHQDRTSRNCLVSPGPRPVCLSLRLVLSCAFCCNKYNHKCNLLSSVNPWSKLLKLTVASGPQTCSWYQNREWDWRVLNLQFCILINTIARNILIPAWTMVHLDSGMFGQ